MVQVPHLERSNFSFSPEFLWIKQRSEDFNQSYSFDVLRGGDKRLQSNERNAEDDVSSYGGGITSFDADGFTLGTWSNNYWNADTENYVGGLGKAGGVPTVDNSNLQVKLLQQVLPRLMVQI